VDLGWHKMASNEIGGDFMDVNWQNLEKKWEGCGAWVTVNQCYIHYCSHHITLPTFISSESLQNQPNTTHSLECSFQPL